MQALAYLFIFPLLLTTQTDDDDKRLTFWKAKSKQSDAVSYFLKMNGQKKITRYANRYDQEEISTFVENIVISDRDVKEVVTLINQKDRFRSQLNDHYSPGVSTYGDRLNKRPQSLMYDIDPDTPINAKIEEENAESGTEGYSTIAYVDLDGLQIGDTLITYFNRGAGSQKEFSFLIVDEQAVNSYGKTSIEIPLGEDEESSEYFGLKVIFGAHHGFSRFENGSVSYEIQIERSLTLPEGTTSKPISKNRVKRRS